MIVILMRSLDLLPFIQTRDAMTVTAKDVEKITHVIMNPRLIVGYHLGLTTGSKESKFCWYYS